jgi:RNase P subunit RPR2
MANEEDNTVQPYIANNSEEYIVVCKECRTTLSPQKVMRSTWYASGMLPPCFGCGGVTMEIPASAYDKFLEDSRNGKRFL